MFDKLFAAQQKAEEVKQRLNNVTVSGEVEAGKIKVIASGNKEVKDILIDESFFADVEREELAELLVIAVNKALEAAENVSQTEMQAMSQDLLGGLGGLGNLFNK